MNSLIHSGRTRHVCRQYKFFQTRSYVGVRCLLRLFMEMEINILYGCFPFGRRIIWAINLLDLRTVSRRITRSLTVASSCSDSDTTSLGPHSDEHKLPHIWRGKPELHNPLCRLCPAHAGCIMSKAWVRLRQILYGIGGLVSLRASALWYDQQDSHC